MADEETPDENKPPPAGPRQDPYVERLRADPSQPAQPLFTLPGGLLGHSDREGYQRLYFSRDLNYYAEFRTEDIVYTEPIPAEQLPLVGLEATRVTLKRDAPFQYTWSRTARPLDEFDLDVRLRPPTTTVQIPRPGPRTDTCDCWSLPWPWGCPTAEVTCVGRTCAGCGTDQTCIRTCGGVTGVPCAC